MILVQVAHSDYPAFKHDKSERPGVFTSGYLTPVNSLNYIVRPSVWKTEGFGSFLAIVTTISRIISRNMEKLIYIYFEIY